MQKWLRTVTVTVAVTVTACGGSIENDSASQSDPVITCDANPAVEVSLLGAMYDSRSVCTHCPMSFVTITTHCGVTLRHLRNALIGNDPQQFVVGSKGTRYFTGWTVTDSKGKTVMGPVEFPSSIKSDATSSGTMVFSGSVSIASESESQFGIYATLSQIEDAAGEFTTADKAYSLMMNDMVRPFESGDVAYADGVSIPLDRITTSTVLYTDIEITPTP